MRALLIAVVVAAVGCGASQGAAVTTPGTQLTISYWPEGRGTGQVKTYTLRCNPAGGTVPRASTVCNKLDTLARPFAPTPKNLICTDQFGGPQQALIVGRHEGNRVWTMVGMRNGCEIARAKRLAFLVPGFPASPNA